MKKRIYRALDVNQMNREKIASMVQGRRITAGIDVAKEVHFGVLMPRNEEVLVTFKWKHLEASRSTVAWLAGLPASLLDVALEPSGTYGDNLRWLFAEAKIPLFRVSPKQAKDAAEIYDGVPSQHDAKAAAIIAWLHWGGRSTPWPERSERERNMVAAAQTMAMYDRSFQQAQGRLEGRLARYWPEVTQHLDLGSATLLELLAAFGSPWRVALESARAGRLMRRVGGHFLSSEKIAEVLSSARPTLGVPMVCEERRALSELAAEARRVQKAAQRARRHFVALSQEEPEIRYMGAVVGKPTAAILVVAAGLLSGYPNAGSYLKSLGLNLRIRSSGKYKGQLKITKRGPGMARQYLYMAVLRQLKDQPIFRAWYEAKVQRDGGLTEKALTALMRKLAGALWWVARGHAFDPSRLFDTSRLSLATSE